MKDSLLARWRFLRSELRGRALVWTFIGAVFAFLVFESFSLLPFFTAGDESLFCLATAGSAWYMSLLAVLISFLLAVNVVLIVRRSRRLRAAGATGLGSLLGLALTGCPSCGAGFLPLFGLSAGLGLPMGGLWFSLASVGVLFLALYWNTTAEDCRL